MKIYRVKIKDKNDVAPAVFTKRSLAEYLVDKHQYLEVVEEKMSRKKVRSLPRPRGEA